MNDRSSLPYRRCAGIALFNADGRVFIGRRRVPEGLDHMPARSEQEWQMPQGGIDEGENPREAALRELWEETGIRSVEFLAQAPQWYAYDLPPEAVGAGWTKKFRGQTQMWHAFRFTGSEGEINIHAPGGGAFKPEFDAWRWENFEALPALIVPFKRPVYRDIVAAFRHLPGATCK